MARPKKTDSPETATPETPVVPQVEAEPAPTGPLKVATLAELSAIIDKPLTVEIDWMGKAIQLEARRLTPAESAMLTEIMDEAIPPIVKGRTMDEDRPDYANADFIKKKGVVAVEARAMAIYWCVKMFREAKPDLKNRKEITDFVQGQLNESVHRALWQAISEPGVKNAALVNFI